MEVYGNDRKPFCIFICLEVELMMLHLQAFRWPTVMHLSAELPLVDSI